MSGKEEFIKAACEGMLMVRRCIGCQMLHPYTIYFCSNCGGAQFENHTVSGRGTVATYTIITVPPAGFEEYTPYAFVVMSLEDADLRISGFMGGIAKPQDLPMGSKARIYGYDERGLLIEKL